MSNHQHLPKPALTVSVATVLLVGSVGLVLAQTSHQPMTSHNSMMSSSHMMQHGAKRGSAAKGAMMKREKMTSKTMSSSTH